MIILTLKFYNFTSEYKKRKVFINFYFKVSKQVELCIKVLYIAQIKILIIEMNLRYAMEQVL